MKSVLEARQLDEHEKALTILNDIYAAEPDNLRVAYEIADTQFELGQHDNCVQFLTPLVDANPQDVRMIFLCGKSLLKLGRYAEAAQMLQRADLLNPYHPERLCDLGYALLGLNQTTEAAEAFDRAQQLDPDDFEATKGSSAVKMLEGQVNEAIQILKGRTSLRELASVFNAAAVIAIRLDQHEKGVNLYESAQAAVANDKNVLAKVFFNKGLGYLRWGKDPEAKAAFAKAVELDPAHRNAKSNLMALEAGKKYEAKPQPMPPEQPPGESDETIIDSQLEAEPEFDPSGDDVDVFQIPLEGEDEPET
jgi:Flp pilus assembly protein TadD